jgi:hypothetical protein
MGEEEARGVIERLMEIFYEIHDRRLGGEGGSNGGSVWVNPKPSVTPQRGVLCPPSGAPSAE